MTKLTPTQAATKELDDWADTSLEHNRKPSPDDVKRVALSIGDKYGVAVEFDDEGNPSFGGPVPQYVVITAIEESFIRADDELGRDVERLIKEGWKPTGGICLAVGYQEIFMSQALTRNI